MKLKLFISVLIIIISFSCSSIDPSLFKKKPTANIERFDIESISLQDITLLFEVRIKNPYPIAINLDKVSSAFIIENKQLFATSSKDKLKIEAKKSTLNPFTVNLKFKDIAEIVKDYSKKDNIDCKLKGEIVLAIPNTGISGVPKSHTFPYELSRKIPTIKPSISVKDFKIEKPSSKEIIKAVKNSGKNINPFKAIKVVDKLLSGKYDEAFKVIKPEDLDLGFNVSFKIELKNDTKAKINFDRLNYDFYLNSDKIISGVTTDIKTVGNKSILNVKNRISLMSFSKSITMALKNKKGDFHFIGETAIKLPDDVKKEPLKLLFNEKGKLKVAAK